jgi:DNA invertase Pin-like site-specific DNA recombinase
MRAVGYIRVSTEEQADTGVSLQAQRAKLQQYAALYDLDLIAVEEDAGVSAKTLDRPGLQAALDRLRRGEADGLVIAKLDRLSRSVLDWNTLIDGYFGERAGKQLWSVSDSIDTRTAAGRLVLNVLMSVAQWEREVIAERTRDALAHKRSRSERCGKVRYGFVLAGDGITEVPNPAEQAGLAAIARLRAEGLSLRAIAAELDRLGVPTKEGRGGWTHTAVARILGRPADKPADVTRPFPNISAVFPAP